MTESTFKECFDWMEKYHGKQGNLNEQVRIEWWEEFRKDSDEVFLQATHYAIDKMPPGLFPSKERMRHFMTEAREFLLQREKERTPTFKDIERISKTTPNGRMALDMMHDLYAGRINRDQYLARMFAMEEKFPGIGWKKEAEELKEFWATESKRHAEGRKYLERIWDLQDSDPKFKAIK